MTLEHFWVGLAAFRALPAGNIAIHTIAWVFPDGDGECAAAFVAAVAVIVLARRAEITAAYFFQLLAAKYLQTG